MPVGGFALGTVGSGTTGPGGVSGVTTGSGVGVAVPGEPAGGDWEPESVSALALTGPDPRATVASSTAPTNAVLVMLTRPATMTNSFRCSLAPTVLPQSAI